LSPPRRATAGHTALALLPVPQSLGDWPHNFNVKTPAVAQADLFPAPAATLPEGLVYQREFLTLEEEAALIEVVAQMPLEEMRYKRYTARRRVLSFGGQYDFDANRLQPAAPLPCAQKWLRLFEQHPPIYKWKTLCGLPKVQSCPRRRSALATNRPTRWATRGAPGFASYAASFNCGRLSKYISSGVACSRLE
jgi:hypothetical protein